MRAGTHRAPRPDVKEYYGTENLRACGCQKTAPPLDLYRAAWVTWNVQNPVAETYSLMHSCWLAPLAWDTFVRHSGSVFRHRVTLLGAIAQLYHVSQGVDRRRVGIYNDSTT